MQKGKHMSCKHEWVAVGTDKFCVKCGHKFGEPEKKPTKKKVSTAKAE